MKKYFHKSIVSLFCLVVTTASFAVPTFAQVAASNSADNHPRVTGDKQVVREQIKSQNDTERINNLKARANQEIERRIRALTEVQAKITAFKHLTDAQKASLTTQITSQIDALNALNTKIAADTTLVTLKADVQSIITSYRIFALYIPQLHILAAAEKISDVAVQMASVEAKLQTKVQTASSSGQDVTSLQATLLDMTNKISDAKAKALNAEDLVIALTPSTYPANKASLRQAQVLLATAREELTVARHDAATILSQLRAK